MKTTVTREPSLCNCYVIVFSEKGFPPIATIVEYKPTRKEMAEHRKYALAHFAKLNLFRGSSPITGIRRTAVSP